VTADDSFPFLAPERITGGATSHRADLFSAGAALFFLCTGKTLVAGTNRTELQAAWPKTRPELLAEMRPDLPAKFVQWLCRLLELDPEKRPESAVDALASLAALNPPSPPVPPESFRPRPASKISALPIASGIVKPPLAQAKPVSAIRQQPPASAIKLATAKPPAKPPVAPVKKSHVAMTVGLFVFLVALISGGVWFFFLRDTESKPAADEYAARPVSTATARDAAPSVGRNVGK
jgi:serine/threonine protein kinase